jgi:hypothetical protein
MGRLGLTSPPSRSVYILTDHRYYDPLRLPTAHLGFLRSSLLASDTLRASAHLCFHPRLACRPEANNKRQDFWSPSRPHPLGIFTQGDSRISRVPELPLWIHALLIDLGGVQNASPFRIGRSYITHFDCL